MTAGGTNNMEHRSLPSDTVASLKTDTCRVDVPVLDRPHEIRKPVRPMLQHHTYISPPARNSPSLLVGHFLQLVALIDEHVVAKINQKHASESLHRISHDYSRTQVQHSK